MARVRNYGRNRFENGARASIGDSYVENACAEINRAFLKEAAMFTEHFDTEQVTPMILSDEAIVKLKAVHGLLAWEDKDHTYNLAPYANGNLTLFTRDRPAAALACFEWHPVRAEPLRQAVEELNRLHAKWGAVKHLLRWFNRNATPSAVRANWPSVLVLCPDSPSLKELQHAPVRYTNPQELSALLPLIRATATTVAAMKMLPGDVRPRTKETVLLELPARYVDYEGATISLDQQLIWM